MSESPHPHNSDRNLLIEYSECNGNFLGWIGVQRTILWLTQFFGKAKYNSIDWRMWQHSTSLMTLITPIELLNRREFQRPPAISFDLFPSSIATPNSFYEILRSWCQSDWRTRWQWFAALIPARFSLATLKNSDVITRRLHLAISTSY